MRRAMTIPAAAAVLAVLAGCGGGDGAKASVPWTSPCELLLKGEIEKVLGTPLEAQAKEGSYGHECFYRAPNANKDLWVAWLKSNTNGTGCTDPGSEPAPEIDAEAYKSADNGFVVVGGPYHGHCLRLTTSGGVDSPPVTVEETARLLRTVRSRME
ncbi:hypothetical protein [Streptomyces sp. NPDC054838]